MKKTRHKSHALRPTQNTKLKGDLKEQKNKNNRVEVVMIDGMAYRVVVEENNFATQTPYDAISRLIHNNRERICCLGPDGGM